MSPDALAGHPHRVFPQPRRDPRGPEDVALEIIRLCSAGNNCEDASGVHRDATEAVTRAIRNWVANRRWEQAAQLLTLVPLPPEHVGPELARLRAEVALYEFKRVARVRRRLVCAITMVLFYLFAVSPTLFVQLENPTRAANHMSILDWSEGLYWSVITAMTVGYGDIAPQTPYARLLSLWNATLGVTLMGVIAGLILGLVTPRRMA